ncbi:hypothetical protein [Nocardia sp. SSK8]|uniref:hypothetical protein n=1 Tax=Nocardia sp. SSK8 TaxID=3120154 RepID=UPI003009E983
MTLLIICTVIATSCSDDSDNPDGWRRAPELTYLGDVPVDKDLTAGRAQDITIAHVRSMVSAFAFEISLTGYNSLAPSRPSCVLDKLAVDPPHRFMTSYQVEGATGKAGLQEFMNSWRQMGWKVSYKAGLHSVDYETNVIEGVTPDHYSMNMQVLQEKLLVLTAVSPCFPFTPGDPADAIPLNIP